VLEFGGNWEEHIALVKFTYNNSHQAIIGMAPYKALYGRRCRTPLCWEEVGDQKLYGAKLVQVTSENVRTIKDRIKAAQDRQEVKEDLTLELRPIRILDREVKELRNKKIPIIKILWRNAQIE
jgi:hypothetical protein